jgi:hypothetical protein
MHGNSRVFTRDEDALIIEQSNGRMTFAKLLIRLRATRESVQKRARALGVTPWLRQQVGRKRTEHSIPWRRNTFDDGEVYHVDKGGAANELRLLGTVHKGRQYESLKIMRNK